MRLFMCLEKKCVRHTMKKEPAERRKVCKHLALSVSPTHSIDDGIK